MKKYTTLFIGILLLCIIAFLKSPMLSSIDAFVYTQMHHFSRPFFTSFFIGMTQLGGAIIIGGCMITWLVVARKKALPYIFHIIVIFFINSLLKMIFARLRPEFLHLVHAGGFSFPSAHAMMSFACYGFLLLYLYDHHRNSTLYHVARFILPIIIFIVGLSRVYLGVHFFSDVVAGWCIVGLYLIGFRHFSKETLYK